MPTNTQFSNEHLLNDLKGHSVRGGVATFTGQGIKFILNLGSTMILARLLLPKDFGLIAMVTTITSFILVFNDLGLSAATIQRLKINHGQVSTLFWINVALGILLMCITSALAPAIAWFYQDTRLTIVTITLSTAFFFGGLTVQHQALLRRQMRLSAVAMVDVSSMMVGILTAILCACAGWEYWALVWMQIATAATSAIGSWIACAWRPGWPVRRSGVRAMLQFGGYMTGFSLVNYFSRNFDNVLIGRYCGAQPLGLYSRAYSLLLVPIGQIVAPMTSVAVPALSKLQHDPISYRSYYLKAIRMIAYLSFPLVATLAVLSEEVVTLVLGIQWIGATPIFRILAVAAMFQPVASTVGWIYISLGQTRRMAIWGLIASPLIVLSFIIGLPWGALGVATSYVLCSIMLIHPQLAFATSSSPLAPFDIYKESFRPFCVSIITGVSMLGTRLIIPTLPPLWTIAVSVMVGGIMMTASILLWPAAKKDLRDILSSFELIWKKKLSN